MTIDGVMREALQMDPSTRSGVARELSNSIESQTG